MRAAHIYITDVSSSVFEWFYFDRPTIFFDTKQRDWLNESGLAHWRAGIVCGDVVSVINSIDEIISGKDEHKQDRALVLEQTFSFASQTESLNTTQMIIERLRDYYGRNHEGTA